MFRIEQKSKLEFKPPVFKCDKCISDQIEPPLPSKPHFLCIVGSAGSGKTSFMVNLLTNKAAYKKVYESVHVIMPKYSVASLKNNVFKNHDKMHDELDFQTLSGISEKIKEDAEDENNSLLILDDVTVALKDKLVQRLLRDLILNRRHYRLSIWLLVQTYNAIPLPVRKTVSHLVMFKPRNRKETDNVFGELVFLDREVAEKLHGFVFDAPYRFLMADVDGGLLYKNFDRIIINAP